MGIQVTAPAPTSGTYETQFQYVSIDEMTAFCEVQLQAADKQIRSMTVSQQSIVVNGENLASAQNDLNDIANAMANKDKLDKDSSATDSDSTDAAAFKVLTDKLNDLRGLADNSSEPAKSAIKKEIDTLVGHLQMDDNKNPPQPIQVTTDLLKQDVLDMAKDLQPTIDKNQSDQSMNMIKVQSAVSQREQMVQLVTGIIQKMNEMTSSVVANIGK